MRRLFFVLALLLLPAPLAAAQKPAFTEAESADLKRVSAYLNGIANARGRFLQIGPDGTPSEGTFYLRKPGRMRFEYDKPNPTVVVADGATIAVENTDLKTTDRYPLGDSPLRMLLNTDLDLANDEHVAAVRREEGAISVVARQEEGAARGEITLVFADAGGGSLELRQWEVVDAQGLKTHVAVIGLEQGVELSPSLFVVRELNPFRPH